MDVHTINEIFCIQHVDVSILSDLRAAWTDKYLVSSFCPSQTHTPSATESIVPQIYALYCTYIPSTEKPGIAILLSWPTISTGISQSVHGHGSVRDSVYIIARFSFLHWQYRLGDHAINNDPWPHWYFYRKKRMARFTMDLHIVRYHTY
jgi:hypothetical protein